MSGRLGVLLVGLGLAAMAACTWSAQAEGTPTPPPIIVVSLDTFRGDALGEATPNLNRLAAESMIFTAAHANANETLFSHASMFTSRYPSELGAVDYSFEFPATSTTLAEAMGAHGYDTAGFVAGGHLSPIFGLQKGFDTWSSVREWGSLFHTLPPALAWLDAPERKEPWFLFLHGYDTHARYLKPPPFGEMFTSAPLAGDIGDAIRRPPGTARIADGWYLVREPYNTIFRPQDIRGRGLEARARIQAMGQEVGTPLSPASLALVGEVYQGAVAYTDLWVGRLMAGLESRGLLDTAWIVILGDHGEELGEDGVFNHRLSLSAEVLHVPLIIRPPGGKAGGQRIDTPVSLLDLMPTLLDIMGAKPAAGMRGLSLLGEIPARALHAESPLREISVLTPDGQGMSFTGISPHSPFLPMALKDAQDGGPAWRAWAGSTLTIPAARERMLDWRSTLPTGRIGQTQIDPARLKLLREKGYWGAE